jgi:O-antigen/teichoic acid export membrane protein
MITLPMGVGVSLIAAPMIRLGFGERWIAAVPLVQVVAVVSVARVVANISSVLLNAHGMIRVQFRIMLAGLVIRAILLVVLLTRFGLMGAVAAATAGIAIEETMFLIVTFREFHLRAVDLLHGVWRCVIATVAMAAGVWWEGLGWTAAAGTSFDLLYSMALGSASGAAIYIAVLLLTWWVSGRPRGAETFFLDVAGGAVRHRFGRDRRACGIG